MPLEHEADLAREAHQEREQAGIGPSAVANDDEEEESEQSPPPSMASDDTEAEESEDE